jgi:hypothetical protein
MGHSMLHYGTSDRVIMQVIWDISAIAQGFLYRGTTDFLACFPTFEYVECCGLVYTPTSWTRLEARILVFYVYSTWLTY